MKNKPKNNQMRVKPSHEIHAPDFIRAISPYVPGKPLAELEREYGISGSIKLASNENPLGPSPKAIEAIQDALGQLNRYPDGGAYELTQALSSKLDTAPECIVVGNGSDDLIGMLTRALLQPGDEAVMPLPSFLMYDIGVRCAGAKPVPVSLSGLDIDLVKIRESVTSATRLVFLTNPNNPTGTAISKADFDAFLRDLPRQVVVIVDEAYIEFVRDERCAVGTDYLSNEVPVVVLRTFSKAYGLAGIRVGYGVMPMEISALLHRVRQPFNVSSLAQVAAVAALTDQAFLAKTVQLVHTGLDYLYAQLDCLGVDYFTSQSNFFLIDVKQDATGIFEKMLKLGVIVRSMSSYGYPEYIRVNVGLPKENERFIRALQEVL